MKRLLLFVSCVLLFAWQTTAQLPTPAKKANYEKQVRPMAAAVMLGITRGFVNDLPKMNLMMGSDDMIKVAAGEYPPLSKEFANTAFLEKMPVEKRTAAVDDAATHIRGQLSGSDIWQFDVGACLGSVMRAVMVATADGKGVDMTKLNESEIKADLGRLRALTDDPPADFPKDLLERLRLLAAQGKIRQLTTGANLVSLAQAIVSVVETISPDPT